MTNQEQIEILERAIPLIDTTDANTNGVCASVFEAIYGIDTDNWDGDSDWCDLAEKYMNDFGIRLPPAHALGSSYCWPLTPKGDAQRRAFLRRHIERLKKEL